MLKDMKADQLSLVKDVATLALVLIMGVISFGFHLAGVHLDWVLLSEALEQLSKENKEWWAAMAKQREEEKAAMAKQREEEKANCG